MTINAWRASNVKNFDQYTELYDFAGVSVWKIVVQGRTQNMTDKLRFGQFISEKRIQHSMTKQELARQIGISTAYLSQLESGARSNPTIEVLDRMINKFHLDEAETHKIYDLYAASNDTISPDIITYLKSNNIVTKAIRKAQENSATEKDWLDFIDQLQK